MDDRTKQAIPRYQQIAIEIASRIVSEEYNEGQKIYARSSIASQFGVSPETARRAICVLCDLDIVSSEKGSGVTIKSKVNAQKFVTQFEKRKTLDSIKENLLQSFKRQQQEIITMNACLDDLISASEHFRSINPFMPFEIKITSECKFLNKNISEIQLWQRTGATVIAVRRNDNLLKSPGPYASLQENDIFYFISQDDSSDEVKSYLYL
jgi:K+/H+ antiporter YhaU regulatory subunit KhtT